MTFGILGPLDVRDISDRSLAIRRRKARTLLALLICHRDQDVSAELLTEWLWGARPPASALANLRGYVSDLRRALAGTTAAGGLHTTRDGYLLQIRNGQLDADRFADLAAAGSRALHDGDASEAVEHLGRAAGLWRGDILVDVTLPAGVRSRLADFTERRLEVLTSHAEARIALGRHHEVAVDLTTLTPRFPRYEPLWRQLMQAHAHAGRHDEVDLTYDRLLTAARADGAEPSTETVELRERIRRGDIPAVRACRSPARRPSPRHLPAPPDRFVGRSVELAALDRAAACGQLVTISGGPGVGKTGLALIWAHRVADRYPDGQLHVELHGHAAHAPADAREVLVRMLRAVGAEHAATSSLPEATAALRTALAGRRMLIMLDDAVSEAQVRPLLPGIGSCLTVVTSRNRLDGLVAHEGATRMRLGELSPAEARRLLLDMRETTTGSDDVTWLAERCGYLPLALRILAANGYEGDPLVASDGERSVRAAFDASWSRLGEPERHVFRALGRLPEGPFTVAEAAAGLTAERSHIAEMLGRLDRVSLVGRLGSDLYQLSPMAHRYAARMTASGSAILRHREWLRISDVAANRRARGFDDRTGLTRPARSSPW
jgi:DNA-binding SARP family transcriptional activator